MPKKRPAARYKRIAFVASDVPAAQRARRRLVKRYGDVRPETADVVVALGGDGLMLATLQRFMNTGKPIYGMHRGTVGFLMNEYSDRDLLERLAAAQVTVIHPLLMRARDVAGRVHRHRAINEVSLFRQTYQAARLRILVDGKERLEELVADGVLLATPAARPRTIFRCKGRSFRSGHPCSRSPRLAHSGRDAGMAPCCRIARALPSRCSIRESARLPPSPITTRYVRCARSISAWITPPRCTCCSTQATASTSASSASSSGTRRNSS